MPLTGGASHWRLGQSGSLWSFVPCLVYRTLIALLAVAAAIAMLGLTLAVPRMSVLVTEPPFAYADAS